MASKRSGSTSSVHGKRQKKSPMFQVKLNSVKMHHRKKWTGEQQYTLLGRLAVDCIAIYISFINCFCQFSFQFPYSNDTSLLICFFVTHSQSFSCGWRCVSSQTPCSVILFGGIKLNPYDPEDFTITSWKLLAWGWVKWTSHHGKTWLWAGMTRNCRRECFGWRPGCWERLNTSAQTSWRAIRNIWCLERALCIIPINN